MSTRIWKIIGTTLLPDSQQDTLTNFINENFQLFNGLLEDARCHLSGTRKRHNFESPQKIIWIHPLLNKPYLISVRLPLHGRKPNRLIYVIKNRPRPHFNFLERPKKTKHSSSMPPSPHSSADLGQKKKH